MKAVITVIGMDRVGIIFDVTKVLAQNDVNILDISQTILDGYFTMLMITDISKASTPFDQLRDNLMELGKSINMDIKIQHEDIFNSMHKI